MKLENEKVGKKISYKDNTSPERLASRKPLYQPPSPKAGTELEDAKTEEEKAEEKKKLDMMKKYYRNRHHTLLKALKEQKEKKEQEEIALKEAEERKKKKVREKVVNQMQIQSKVFDVQPYASATEEINTPVISEMNKSGVIAKQKTTARQKSMKRGNSISNLQLQKTYRDDRSVQSRGSTREGRSKKPGSASQSRTGTDFKRGRTLTPTARRTTKHEKFPKLEPLSPEDQEAFDEKKE